MAQRTCPHVGSIGGRFRPATGDTRASLNGKLRALTNRTKALAACALTCGIAGTLDPKSMKGSEKVWSWGFPRSAYAQIVVFDDWWANAHATTFVRRRHITFCLHADTRMSFAPSAFCLPRLPPW